MARATDIERAAMDGATQTTLSRLVWALIIVWLPTAFVFTLAKFSGLRTAAGGTESALMDAGTGASEPMGGLKAVLFVPMSAVMEFGALWWGGAVWLQERRKRHSHHRRRRRKPLEKFLQRLAFVLVPVSMVANIPLFVWYLKIYYQSSIKF